MIRLFRVFVPTGTVTMLTSELLWVTAAFVATTFVAMPTDPVVFLFYDNGWLRILLMVVCAVISLHFQDLYSDLYVKSRAILLQQLCLTAGSILVLQGLISYAFPYLRVPIRVMVPGVALATLVMFVWRIIFSSYVLEAMSRDRLLLVGPTAFLEEIGSYVAEHPETGSRVAGYITGDCPPGTQLRGGKVLAGPSQFLDVVEETQPSRIVVAIPEHGEELPMNELLDLRFAGQTVEEAAAAYERIAGRVCLKALPPSELIYSGEYGPPGQEYFYQTILNRLVALGGLVLALPLLFLAAAAVKFSSRGPAISGHVRTGLGGKPFRLLKFRCLRLPDGAADIWVPKDDPRVTRVGRVLRTTRVDELPQLINVLVGDMSLIGPRAERPDFVKRLAEEIPCYQQRHLVRPGITGWAQINHKDELILDALTSLEYDLYYIKNISTSLDTMILAHTLKAVVVSHGED